MKGNEQASEQGVVGIELYTRRAPRYQTSLLVRQAGQQGLVECRGNVSAGGFCFAGAERLEPGTRVDLLFRVPGAGVWLSAQGVILGCLEDGNLVANRGRFTWFDLGDTRNLEGWFEMIRRQQAEGHVDDPEEQTVFSLTVG